MKKLSLFLGLIFTQFVFGQDVYTTKQVDKLPTYSACNNKIDENCFTKKLSSKVNEELLEYANKLPAGMHLARINFTIDENGKFTDFKYSGDENLGKRAVKALEIIALKEEADNIKIIPATVKGKAVKMSYSLPVKIMVDA